MKTGGEQRRGEEERAVSTLSEGDRRRHALTTPLRVCCSLYEKRHEAMLLSLNVPAAMGECDSVSV